MMNIPDACVEVSSLEDVSRWVQHGLWVALTQFEQDADHLGMLASFADVIPKLIMSTAFSGVSCPDVAFTSIRQTLEIYVDAEVKAPRSLFAVERNREAQFELQMLPNKPEHIFVDMTDCITGDHDFTDASFEMILSTLKAPGAITQSMPCVVHGQRCRADKAHIHVAGPPCVDWSAQGLHKRTNGPTTSAFVAWACQRMLLQEDFILHENVQNFPVAILEHVFGDIYIIESVVFCCSQLGLAAERVRRYTWMRHKRSVVASPSATISTTFPDAISRQRRRNQGLTWRQYFELASDEELAEELAWASGRTKSQADRAERSAKRDSEFEEE